MLKFFSEFCTWLLISLMNSYDNKRKILFPTDIFKFKLTLICLLTKLTKIPYNIEMIKFEPN